MDQILLQKQVHDNAKDLQDFCKELKEWGDEMKKKDDSLKRSTVCQAGPSEVPLPKCKLSKVCDSKLTKDKKEPEVKQNRGIKGTDYTAWEKFDADAYCAKLDKQEADENSSPESELSDEIDESSIDLANSEKEKGNTFVKKQQWDQAINCYTKAIECYAYDPIYYANRALCYLKKEQYRNAESDCTTALQLDKTYVKAYQRRAAARENLNQISEAHGDLLKVLEFEPKNKESKIVLVRIEKKLESTKEITPETTEQQRPVSKFTLSRQKHKTTAIDRQTKVENPENVPAFGQNVVERVAHSNVNPVKESLPNVNNIQKDTKTSDSGSNINSIKRIQPVPTISKSLSDILLSSHNINDIQLFKDIQKPPKARSKKPLKRIQIINVDLDTEKNYLPTKPRDSNILESDIIKDNKLAKMEKNTTDESASNYSIPKSELDENESVSEQSTTYGVEKSDLEKSRIENVSEKIEVSKMADSEKVNVTIYEELDLSVPKTAIQFYNDWKTLNNNKDWRKNYLLKIKPNNLPVIFKESLESKVFSEILEIINDNLSTNSDLYQYLLALSQVKRFGPLVMFMSSSDKKCVSSIVDYLKKDNKYTNADIDNIIKLYEL